MRIPPDTSLSIVQRNLATLSQRLNKLRSSIASGLSLNRPSDDPSGAVRALSLRNSIALIQTRKETLAYARRWLAFTDQALDSIGSAIREARDIAVKAGNEPITSAGPSALAKSLENIKARLLELGNSRLEGRYIFAGNATLTTPFVLTGDPSAPVAYNGDTGVHSAPVTPATDITLNISGDSLFNIGGAADPAKPDVFQVLETLMAAIQSGDQKAASEQIAGLDELHEIILLSRLDIGSRIQRVDAASSDLLALKIALESALNDTQGVDLSAAVTDLQAAEVAYQAALNTAARIARSSNLFYYI